MNENDKPRFSLTMWIVLGVVLLALCGMAYPLFVKQRKCEGLTETVSNARLTGLALSKFEIEYGRFPDESTAAKIREKTGGIFTLGNSSSNDFFRQLIAAGFADNENLFYAKTRYTKKPDGTTDPGDKALAPGEAGFGYLMDGNAAFNSKGNLSRPLVCSPLAFDGKTVSDKSFDTSIHNNKAVVLRMDLSVTTLHIVASTGRAMLAGEKHLLQTGGDTVWGVSAKPVIVPPLPKP